MDEDSHDDAGDSGLKKAFKTANHIRHTLMDLSMIGMAIGALVATGGAVGLFDPVIAFFKMHVSGIPALFTAGPEFLTDAFNNAMEGTFFTGTEATHHMAMNDMGAMNPTSAQQGMADMYGSDADTLGSLMNGHAPVIK